MMEPLTALSSRASGSSVKITYELRNRVAAGMPNTTCMHVNLLKLYLVFRLVFWMFDGLQVLYVQAGAPCLCVVGHGQMNIFSD